MPSNSDTFTQTCQFFSILQRGNLMGLTTAAKAATFERVPMTFVSDFIQNGVDHFLQNHTVYLPGVGADGGTIDFSDDDYQDQRHTQNRILVPASVIEASWAPGIRENGTKLVLKVSPAYKMKHLGRTVPVPGERGKVQPMSGSFDRLDDELMQQARSGGMRRKKQSYEDYVRIGHAAKGLEMTEWFSCYFLPYSQGRYAFMKLGEDADYFFTAAMNGCSFMVSGDVQRPTVCHLNTMKPEDTRVGAVVTKEDIRKRYLRMTGLGSSGSALLSKYKAKPGFRGQTVQYEVTDDELDGIVDEDLVPNAHQRADLNCFVAGQRTDRGWRFYYQRSAVMATNVNKITRTVKAVPKSLKHKIRKKLGWTYKVKPKITQHNTLTASINHIVTQSATLPFNLPMG